ncbi:DUF5666 domain-containing protein [Microbacterium candidum]|uniref:DUF5666 domain-containing protein n=1 Tax=Microbacterium candidum TaxID=3041922 RepID=A0ABT7MWP8_9MICO|nr:DUF5666 domain-containing protein [Microbacterium sp. ASV49]MDL9978873.1 DUF5666 domain-containing protein [Microbacterium sp. ASV49]
MNTRRLALVALVVAAGLGLAGCAASNAPSPAASAAQGAPNGDQGGGFGGGQNGGARAFPGTSGLVAAVSGSTAQVQSAQRQTAVTWTSSTTFTTQVAGSTSDIAVGDCVVARPARTGTGGSSGSGGSGGSGATTVAAATIAITTPTNGSCTAGFGGFGGQRPSGAPTPRPSTGSGNGTGAPRGLGGFGATGKVTSVGSGSFVVSMTRGSTTRDVTVTFTSSTTVTKQQAGSAADVVVGTCVLALGKTDDTGALTANSIAVSPAVNGACTNGFGGRGGGNGFGGGNGGGNGGTGGQGTGGA